MILRNELIKFYEAMHIKMGMTVDVPCGISIIEDVDTYLEQLKLNVVVSTYHCESYDFKRQGRRCAKQCDSCEWMEKKQ